MNDMLLEYIDRIIDEEKDHRVFSVEFNDKTYYVKQDISNHRSSWIKPAPRASFDYEFYKISFVNTQLPVAPVIAGFREHYFVTEGSGKTLTYYSELPAKHPDDDSLQDMVTHIFYSFGKHWDNFMTMVCPMAVLPCEISPMIQILIRLLY